MDLHQHKVVLRSIRQILKHQKEKELLKDEKFNVFSILKMETRENATHSAFLAALLDPSGTHFKGSVFLELFLKCINNNTIDVATAKVKTEHHIGFRDITDKTGGRIDIYIWDKKGNCLSIENKINAGDQLAQIERYCNHNKLKNEVYYLTLKGDEPTEGSKGELKSGIHFFNISYSSIIVKWLTLCSKEAADSPILRETIKQYIILIKKLTHTMDDKEEDELFDIILQNYEASLYLAANVKKAIAEFNNKIRQSIYDSLTNHLSEKYSISFGNGTEATYSQIWIRIKGYQGDKLLFGIQNFSVNVDPFFGKGIIIGVFTMNGKYLPEYEMFGKKDSNYWSAVKRFTEYDNYEIDLQNPELLNKLYNKNDFYNGFVNHIVKETIDYLAIYTPNVISFLNKV
ncbi:PD-(D/E)XK nuclease family protein [Flavobacterium sp.]|uniref:PDDEXK-like family protein n=1 Tax=Flavobacterium sp. TaxID=239 RepID=UPI00374FF0A0